MSVQYRLEGEVAILTLARPEVSNAIDAGLSKALCEALGRSGTEARALVLTGAGKAFCSGADLADLMADYERGGPDLASVIEERFNPALKALLEVPVPTVAAINGAAAGAGMGLAFACDLRVASTAAFFVSAFINVALVPDSGTSWFLPHMIGLSRASEMVLSGRRVPADEALAIGLVHRLVEPDQLKTAALEWGRQLAAGPTAAYVASRQLLLAAAGGLETALRAEQMAQGDLGKQPDHLEGMRAFIAKRQPNFKGANRGL